MSLIKSVTTVGGLTMVSRVLGFVRDVLIASFIGAGPVADAFFVAFKLPNLFRRLFAEGAFNSAFVPLFSKRLEGEGEDKAKTFAEETLGVLLLALVSLLVLAEVAMPWIVRVVAPGFIDDPAKFEMTVLFARIMFPYLVFVSLLALLSGVLNSYSRFAAAASAQAILNVVLIAVLALIVPVFGMPGMMLAWGVVVAGAAQFLWLIFACHRIGVSLRLPRPRLSPGVRRLIRLAVPGAVAGGIGQLNLFIGNIIASLQDSAVSYLYYADRLYQLPLGVIGVAIGVVLLPDLSRRLRAEDGAGIQASQNRALEFSMLLTLPAAAALIAIPVPIVTVLFERGAFGTLEAQQTAMAAAAFAIGLPAYVLIKVFSPAYFAREDMVTPLRFAAIGVGVNIVGSATLFFFVGHIGIALATSVAAWTNCALLGSRLLRSGHFVVDRRLRERLPKILLSSALMGMVLYAGAAILSDAIAGPEWQRIPALVLLVGGGAALYGALALAVGGARLVEVRRVFARGT